ncbi:D-alanyl-lipoteichoic acid acyltransferase DltB (MBOAT superfamily) [Trinickia symbiotica]|uniref:Probable alginate O-acetylase AlgI n=1 Tax=Trinickia symbiotica TaxID=863227 RepID=A0A2N7X1W8_9BURK|nr:MBOAT family O-acyltransferase [Trinickia symbiotica]PMS35758.1 MBOAT family protein [Trinickia symbiotica]PPK44622.1 D-alanyl-lipoteichoic acid acyltransferase DltB (MBOAT superfamily) [Trinickia symbiotica]
MLFNSFLFLTLFLPIALAGYYTAGARHPRAAALWLCAASIVFYGAWNPAFVGLLAISIAFNYAMSRAIMAAAPNSRARRAWLAFAIAIDLGVLVRYKYLALLAGTLIEWTGIVPHGALGLAAQSVALPLGVSFFTFTQIGYLLDCNARIVKTPDALGFVQFVTFFPHLIAGPILHHKEMMTQFAQPETYRWRAENFSVGATVFAMGLAKKLLLADPIAPFADAGFAAPGSLQTLAAWGTCLAYAMQLYFDFSGYSDMAVGLAKLFGVRFPLNFNSPFKATSIIDFWQRWHMTLTRYLSAYLYYPLAMRINRGRAARGRTTGRAAQQSVPGFATTVAVPTFYTMGLAGIWHGAGLQYLIYGLLHAGYLTINHAYRAWRAEPPTATAASGARAVPHTGFAARLRHVANVLVTFVAVLVAFVFFRAHGMDDAWALLKGMLGLRGIESIDAWPIGHASIDIGALEVLRLTLGRTLPALQIAALLAIAWFAPNSHQLMGRFSPALDRAALDVPAWLVWRPSWRWAVVTFALLFVCAAQLHGEVRFLYFQF